MDKTNLFFPIRIVISTKMINEFQKLVYNRLLIEQQIDKTNLQERDGKERKTLLELSFYCSNIK